MKILNIDDYFVERGEHRETSIPTCAQFVSKKS